VNVALLHNARPEVVPADLPDDTFEEYDSDATIASIAGALRALRNVHVEPVPADSQLPWRLRDGQFDFVFNMAEGQGRRCREAIPAAVCELLGLPFTGSDPLTLGMTLDKNIAKRVVSPDVPVPHGVLVEDGSSDGALSGLHYPVIVKPNDEGSSKGIRENPVLSDSAAALHRCRWLRSQYDCPALVEEFLPGTEITVGVAGNGSGARILGMMEISSPQPQPYFVYSLEVKRDYRHRVRYHIPPRVQRDVMESLGRLALTAYRLLGCRDIARMDFRLDGEGLPRFMECNPLPGLNPETGDIVLLSRPALSYNELVQGILLDAMERAGVRQT
jgi:D-alanine-D-alanine ligase